MAFSHGLNRTTLERATSDPLPELGRRKDVEHILFQLAEEEDFVEEYKRQLRNNWTYVIYELLSDPNSSRLAAIASGIVFFFIILSSITLVLETLPEYRFPSKGLKSEEDQYPPFAFIEFISVIVFSFEYFGKAFCVPWLNFRIIRDDGDTSEWVNISHPPKDFFGRRLPEKLQLFWVFFWQPMNLVDFLAILPFYMELCIGNVGAQLTILRILRLLRVLRLFKLAKYVVTLQMYIIVFIRAFPVLLVLMFFCSLCIILTSSLIFFAERGKWDAEARDGEGAYTRDDKLGHPGEITPFLSIVHSMWWSIVTFNSVGYGDFYPTSVSGKLIAVGTMIVGVIGLSMPISVINSTFQTVDEEARKKKENKGRRRQRTTPLMIKKQYQKSLRRIKKLKKFILALKKKEEVRLQRLMDRRQAGGIQASLPIPRI